MGTHSTRAARQSKKICCQSIEIDKGQTVTVIKTISKLIFSSLSTIRQSEFSIMNANARNVIFLRWQIDPCRLACCQIFVLPFTTGTAPRFLQKPNLSRHSYEKAI